MISKVGKREFVLNVKIFDHLAKLLEGDFPIVVLIRLDNGSIYQLLQLHFSQIASNHHLEDCEQLSIRDVTVSIQVVHLECKFKFVFRGRGRGKLGEA